MASYDVIVIGSGPGGYVSAIRCAQLGLKTACVEGRDTLGGTCLNVGCIPSKALLHASHQLHEAQHNFAKMGLIAEDPKVDWAKMQGYKTEVIDGNTKGIEFLFKKNKIDWLKGWGSIHAAGQVKVGDDIHQAKHIIIASGSEPSSLPGIEIDEKTVVTSTGALALDKIPSKMVVIGAGVIGLELGSVYARLGTEVEVIEFLDDITPGMDGEVQKTFLRILKKQGLKFTMGAAVQSVAVKKGKATVSYVKRKKDTTHELEADVVLVATGRRPYVDGLGLDALGVEMTPRGQIKTNAHWQTNVAGLYAIGDIAGAPWLAHKASHEGVMVAEMIAGQKPHAVRPESIAGCTYCHPQVASVGYTEAKAKELGYDVKVGRFPFVGNGKAIALGEPEGMVKTVFDAKTGELLGAHMVGAEVTELIQGYVVGRQLETTEEDLMQTVFPHPTLSEMMHESVLDAYGRAIHF